MAQVKIFFARLCVYIGFAMLITLVVLKFRKSDRHALVDVLQVRPPCSYPSCRNELLMSEAFQCLRPHRWWLARKDIFIMHFVVAVLCSAALWAMLAVFSMRLWHAIASGKAWSRRRRASCIYAYTLAVIQVRSLQSSDSKPDIYSSLKIRPRSHFDPGASSIPGS